MGEGDVARDFAVWGLGELGRLYAGGALRAGHRVTPLTRATDPATTLASLPSATPILIAVGEADLDAPLEPPIRWPAGPPA